MDDVNRQEQMEEALLRREAMLKCLNRAAVALLAKKEATFEDAMSEGVSHIAHTATIDRASIFRNTEKPDGLHVSQVFRWTREAGCATDPRPEFIDRLYEDFFPRWKEILVAEECVNGPVRLMPEAEMLLAVGCVSLLAIPVLHEGGFWGFVLFENLTDEREFTKDEIGILQSASFLLTNAVIRNEEAQKIRESDEYARLLLDATPLCCRLWDRYYNLIACNEAAVKLFGLQTKQEYIERYFELAPQTQPDGQSTREKAIKFVEQTFENGFHRDLFLYQMPDGSPLPAENTSIRIPYGDGYVVASYSRDLREQEKMVAEIVSRDQLLQTVNRAADILLRSSSDVFEDTMQTCMGMMAKAFGADRMRIIKNTVEDGLFYRSLLYEWCENVPPMKGLIFTTKVSYLETTPVMLEKMLRREYVHSSITDMPASDREWFTRQKVLSILMIPVFDGDRFWGMVGFDNCHDERLYAETRVPIMQSGGMILANALLRHENIINLHNTSTQLEVALADAREANSAKDSFLAAMSHEIRTPLNAVVGLTELALNGDTPEYELEENLTKIYTSGTTILSLVNNILDISKIASGHFELYPIEYDTPSFINDVVTLNSIRIGDRLISFKLSVDENLPVKLYGDDLRVKQVFNNLLSNALKYTNVGTVEWHVGFEQDGDSVWIVSDVRDTGIGIKPEDQQKLFTNYHQVDRQSNRLVEGTGLGLSITKRLVEMMDGHIAVESTFGKGTTFSVRLRQGFVTSRPIGKGTAENLMGLRYSRSGRTKITKLKRVSFSYARVLVVDDISTNLDVIKGLLRRYGLAVDCASCGRQAIEMIRAGSPRYSAVFMDHMMPGMDGVEALRLIREDIGTEYARNLPMIALTANAVVGNEEWFLEQGFQAFLSKPIDLLKLDAILHRLVRDKTLEKERFAVTNTSSNEDMGGLLLDGLAIEGVELPRTLESVGGDKAVLLNVLRSYAADAAILLHNMGDYLAAGNLPDYAIAAHGIKGASNIIFAREVGRIAAKLESSATAGNLDSTKADHPVFAQTMQTLLERIATALGSVSATSVSKPVMDAPEPALLRQLRDACTAFDMSGVDAVMARLEAFQYESGMELVAWLREKVNDVAYEEISARLAEG